MEPIQFVVEDKQEQRLKDFAEAAVIFLTGNNQYEEVVCLANSITELKNDHMTKPDNIHSLPEGFYYRFSGFAGCAIGIMRGKRR